MDAITRLADRVCLLEERATVVCTFIADIGKRVEELETWQKVMSTPAELPPSATPIHDTSAKQFSDAIKSPIFPKDEAAFGDAFDAQTGEQKAEQPMAPHTAPPTSTDLELGMKTMRELCQYGGSDDIRFEAAKYLLFPY